MPFYQMLCIAGHFKEYKHIKDLVTRSARHVMDAGGVVRNIDFWGTQTLPQKMRRHKESFTVGDYWTMYFDTSPRTLRSLTAMMRRDPRVIRWTMLKQGEKVEEVVLPREKTVMRMDYLKSPETPKPWSDLRSM
ncbi:ribosomal protein S6 [Phlebopus sp. FC_14]|nr:ribosomal protein S6 [Phlebopus sp. FC_14]